jgi:hypothetical protein
MRLQKTIPIDHPTWVEQALRFSKIADVLSAQKFPIKDVAPQVAEIDLDILQPLSKGFVGRVRYIQNIVVQQEVPILDAEGLPTDQTETIDTTKEHVIVDYIERMSVQEISAALDQVQPLIPNDITGYMQRQEWCVRFIFLQTVVAKSTFNLPADSWV